MKKQLNGLENRSFKYTQDHVAFVKQLREAGESWEDIALQFNDEFNLNKSAEAVRHVYKSYKNMEIGAATSELDAIKKVVSTRAINSRVGRDNKLLIDTVLTQETFLEAMKSIVDKVNKIKIPVNPIKRTAKKHGAKKMLVLSDLHYGKKVILHHQDKQGKILEKETFNLAIARARVKELVNVFIQEVEKSANDYNIDELIVALIGDIIESSTMHLAESLVGCEFGNSEQVTNAIISLFEDALLPIATVAAKYGAKVLVPCVTGNHDRTSPEKTFNMPGKNNLTWIVYNMLKMLSEKAGLKNVTFIIAVESFLVYEIYPGYFVLLEHGDLIKAHTKQGFFQHIMKRQNQLKIIINLLIAGHTHEFMMFGKFGVVNGTIVGNDGYSIGLGYDSQPSQTILDFVNRHNHRDKLYKVLSVDLSQVS